MRRALQRMPTTGVVHLDQVLPGSSFRQLDDAFLQGYCVYCWVQNTVQSHIENIASGFRYQHYKIGKQDFNLRFQLLHLAGGAEAHRKHRRDV